MTKAPQRGGPRPPTAIVKSGEPVQLRGRSVGGKMRSLTLPDGSTIPVFGLGTWPDGRAAAAAPRRPGSAALKLGLDLDITLIDTAEMYGNGRAEEVVGAAIAGRRKRRLPRQQGAAAKRQPWRHDQSLQGGPQAARYRPARSLPAAWAERLHPLAETIEAFETLRRAWQDPSLGRQQFRSRRDQGARRHGRRQQPGALQSVPRRGIEFDLLP